MKDTLPYLINLPPFMQKDIDFDSLNVLKKLFFVIKGKLVGFIVNKTDGKLFCSLINLLFRADGKIFYEDGKYYKISKNKDNIYYPNKRILRSVVDYKSNLDRLFLTYCLHKVDFDKENVIVDCGSNVGELSRALKLKNINFKYFGFEPDKETFECLEKNCSDDSVELFNKGLSNIEGVNKFYLDNFGGNSSLVYFGENNFIEIETSRLDSFNFGKIKLLKIDAEGHEPEVLIGAKNLFEKIEYISIDFGAERGTDEEMTIVPVNKMLYDNNFSLVAFSEYRFVGLYKNNKIQE